LDALVCALRFFYGVTLGEALIPERIPYAREPRKLPVVLSADEVVQFLEAVSSLKSRAALTTAYAAGLSADCGRNYRQRVSCLVTPNHRICRRPCPMISNP
jgi:integrase